MPGASVTASGGVRIVSVAGASIGHTQQDFDSSLDFVTSTFLHLEGVGVTTATQRQILQAL